MAPHIEFVAFSLLFHRFGSDPSSVAMINNSFTFDPGLTGRDDK